ncbi:tetratricopeptide repeat protein [Sphingomonas panni]|uniref:tetratricopeptide repeat protein n=1 Tax=Sphingomonas panni TaxID=237612 RepID=UPI001F5BD222|nr:tetratricopeptide repeat protein [Sphingomonas panni]
MTCNPDRSIRALLGAAGLGVVAVALASLGGVLPARADAADAQTKVAQALAQFQAGHWTAARDRARAATQADPASGFAQAVLARTQLALGDGAGAQGSLDAATKAGFDPARARQLYAHARLLQGDAAGAMAEADRAAPRYRAYATTIRAQAVAASGDVRAALSTLEARVASAPGDAFAWVALGRMRQDAGDMVGAINAGAAAVRADPASPDALRLRAQTMRTQYGLVAALPWFESALARDPYAHDTLIDYAATLGDAGRSRDMLAAVRRAMAVRPGSPQGLYLQAVLAARAGDLATARSVLDKAGRGLAGVPGALLLSGSIGLAAGEAAQAAIPLRELVARQPTNITSRKLLALALLQSDSAREAFDTILPVASRGDADSYTLLLAARALERIGDRANAAPLFDRAAALARGRSGAFATGENLATLAHGATAAPGNPAAALPYIRALSAGGDAAGALAVAQALADANSGSPAAQLVLGDALAGAGRMGDAATAYARAAATRFDEATMLRLVDACDRAGQRDQASAALSLFLTQNPGNVPALRLLGSWQVAAGEHDAAIETLETLRERVGDRDPAVLALLAFAYAGAGEAEAAQGYAGAAYVLAPSNPMTVDALSWALYAGDNVGAAVPLAVKAVRLAPQDATIRWHMAQIAEAAGNPPVAIANAQAALGDPRFAERAAAKALIAGS